MTIRAFIPILVLAWLAQTPASQADPLKDRFRERLAKINQIKESKEVGETYLGLLEFVSGTASDQDTAKLVEAENVDRKKVYAKIADDVG